MRPRRAAQLGTQLTGSVTCYSAYKPHGTHLPTAFHTLAIAYACLLWFFALLSQSLVFIWHNKLPTTNRQHTDLTDARNNSRHLTINCSSHCSNMSTFTSSVHAQQVLLQILTAPPPFVAALCPPCRITWSALLPSPLQLHRVC